MAGIPIPASFFESVNDNTKENVILLCLSVLNKTPEINHYQKEDYHFNGLVQLEPGTKYFLTKLAEERKKADRIVILESPESRTKLKDLETEYSNTWDLEKSAADIYKERIRAFIRGEEPERAGQADAVLKESGISSTVCYTENELDNLFTEIELESGNRMYFPEMIEAIRSRKEDGGVDLYIDMQGGDRSMIAQINAISELLKDQAVAVKERIAVRYRKGNRIQLIEDVGEQFRSYELITAMNVFKRYGWGNELVEYFKDDNSKPVRNLVEAINKASQAIKLCDVSGFDEAISYIEKLEKLINPEGTSEMDIVYRDIYEDFKPLFHPKYRYVEQIRWCLKKNFIQQALTLLESKMPTEYVKSGLKYYCDEEGEADRLLDGAAEACYDLGKNQKNQQYQFKDINHYFIRSQGRGIHPYIWKEKYGIDRQADIEKNIEEYEALCKLRNGTNHANDVRDGRFIQYAKEKYPKDMIFENVNPEGVSVRIKRYLNTFEKLADQVPEEIRKKIIDLG